MDVEMHLKTAHLIRSEQISLQSTKAETLYCDGKRAKMTIDAYFYAK